MHRWRDDLVNGGRVMGDAEALHDSIETVDFVGGVGDLTDGAIGLGQRVAAVHDTIHQCLFGLSNVIVCDVII